MRLERPALKQLGQMQSTIVLLCLLFVTDLLATRVRTPGNLTFQAGGTATLWCELDGEGQVSQVEWSRCDGPKILVFESSERQLVYGDYQGRVSQVTIRGFMLEKMSVNDSGAYCCLLSTYPQGTLKAHLHLLLTAAVSSTLKAVVISGVLVAVLVIFGIALIVIRQRRFGWIRTPGFGDPAES